MRLRYNVIGVDVDATHPSAALAEIESWIRERRRGFVCFATAHGVTEAQSVPELAAAYAASDLTGPDGMPLVWLGRAHGHPDVARVYGPTITLQLCERAAREGWSGYFYGGAEGVAERLAAAMAGRFPGLRIAGWESPPFRPLTAEEETAAVARINDASPDLVFVGLGCPRQEMWMHRLRARLGAPVLLGVGAAFDFHTGRVKQAPAWMQSAGLEWFFRLTQEPRRLWKRYLVTNSVFVTHVLLQALRLRRYPRSAS